MSDMMLGVVYAWVAAAMLYGMGHPWWALGVTILFTGVAIAAWLTD